MANEGFVRRFQVVQGAPDRLAVNMILEVGVSPEAVAARLDAIGGKIRLLMGEGCRVDYRFVAAIPLTRSGKHPYVVREAPVSGPVSAEAAS